MKSPSIRRLLPLIALLSVSLLAIDPHGGTKTVTTAGTAVLLTSTATPAIWVTIQALSTNTGTICVGSSNVLAASKNGTCITAGQAAPFYAVNGVQYDLHTIWIDASVNGEGVAYTYGW